MVLTERQKSITTTGKINPNHKSLSAYEQTLLINEISCGEFTPNSGRCIKPLINIGSSLRAQMGRIRISSRLNWEEAEDCNVFTTSLWYFRKMRYLKTYVHQRKFCWHMNRPANDILPMIYMDTWILGSPNFTNSADHSTYSWLSDLAFL